MVDLKKITRCRNIGAHSRAAGGQLQNTWRAFGGRGKGTGGGRCHPVGRRSAHARDIIPKHCRVRSWRDGRTKTKFRLEVVRPHSLDGVTGVTGLYVLESFALFSVTDVALLIKQSLYLLIF